MKRYEKDTRRSEVEIHHFEPTKRVNQKDIKRVAAYCRVSTLDEEQELSFETQRAYYENLIAQDPGMVLVRVYGDQGRSGLHTDKRIEFKQMLRDAMDGKIDVIMVKSISRFSRNTVDCLNILKQFKEKGIQVIFEKEGLNSLDPKTEMVLSIFSSIAQNESANISENVRWALEYRNRSGCPSRLAPYGYRSKRQLKMKGIELPENENDLRDTSKHNWVIEPNEAERIKMMFTMASQGYSITRITEKLNKLEKQKGSGYMWNNAHVVNLLRNEAYRGDVLTDKSVQPDYLMKKRTLNRGQADQYYIEDHHPAIVEPVVFERVQELLKNDVLFVNRTKKIRAYMDAHPEMELPGVEMGWTRTQKPKASKKSKRSASHQPALQNSGSRVMERNAAK